jgi:hypothetical protein
MTMHIAILLVRVFTELLGFAAFGAAAIFVVVFSARWLWSLRLKSRGELAKMAGYAAMGPITGPLAARALGHFRGGKPILATVWALAIPLAWAGVASAATVLVHATGH